MPFSKYKDFLDCVSRNKDKDNPEAYCASIHKKVTGEWPTEKMMKCVLAKLEKAVSLHKQLPPGPPPRPGLQWNPLNHRWMLPPVSGVPTHDFANRFPDMQKWFQDAKTPLEVRGLKRQLLQMIDKNELDVPEGAINALVRDRLEKLKIDSAPNRSAKDLRTDRILNVTEGNKRKPRPWGKG